MTDTFQLREVADAVLDRYRTGAKVSDGLACMTILHLRDALPASLSAQRPEATPRSVFVEVSRELLPQMKEWSEPVRVRVDERGEDHLLHMLITRASSAPRENGDDTQLLDWLETQTWITLEKTDESDNNPFVAGVESAVLIRSTSPDGEQFSPRLAATFRQAICAARSLAGRDTTSETGDANV